MKKWAIDNLIDDSKEDFDYCQGDTVWFVVDTDEWEKQGKIKTLRDFCHLQNEAFKNKYDFSLDEDGGLSLYATEVFRLAEEILPFVKRDIDRMRNKMQ